MIGNDIIDLAAASKESNWKRRGFLEKLFTLDEQRYILDSDTISKSVWLLWSMKESAYKIWARQNNQRAFAPKKFECKIFKKNKGVVSFEGSKVFTKSIVNESYISTIAHVNENFGGHIWVGPHSEIAQKLIQNVAQETGLPKAEISLKKLQNGAPVCYHNRKILLNSCSISHHGNYGAFAYEYERTTL